MARGPTAICSGSRRSRRSGARLGDFRFTPVVERFVHEAVDEYLGERELSSPDVYMCGPPPMVEAAEAMLIDRHGLDEQRIFVDKFTTSASAAVDGASGVAWAAAPAASESSERDFSWFAPAGRRATLYEDVTIDTQPSVHRHLSRGWPVSFEDGRGTWNDDSTALRLPRLVRVPRPRRAVGAAVLPAGDRHRAADRRGDAARRAARDCWRTSVRNGSSSCRHFCRCRRTSSTACGSRWRRSAATACPIRWPPACVSRRR